MWCHHLCQVIINIIFADDRKKQSFSLALLSEDIVTMIISSLVLSLQGVLGFDLNYEMLLCVVLC